MARVLLFGGIVLSLLAQQAGAQAPAGQPPPSQPPGSASQNPPGAAGRVPGSAGQPAPAGQPGAAAQPAAGEAGAPAGPIALTLSGALQRAQAYSQQFQQAAIAAQSAHEDVVQAKAGLLPTLNYFNQYIYTQGNGTPSGVFVANDGVHVYNSQAVVHEELFSITKRADYRRAVAAQAAAQARQEIARRGLVATVVQSYYSVIATQRHVANAQQTLREAQQFLDITQKQEQGGEAAHADVVKAQLNVEQRTRDLADAQLNLEKAKIALGVVMFPNIEQQFTIEDDLASAPVLPPLGDVQSAALGRSPDVRAAQAALQQANYGITSARGAYFPSLILDYFFGIDANVFAIRGPDDRKNLGSVVQGTVTIPVWNWGATRSKVRQAELQQKQAQFDLTFAQRQLQNNISTFYLEAQAAHVALESLRRSVDLSAESLRLTLLRYQAGEATALEVSDAQSTLAQARNAYDDGLTRYRVALAEIQTLTGTL